MSRLPLHIESDKWDETFVAPMGDSTHVPTILSLARPSAQSSLITCSVSCRSELCHAWRYVFTTSWCCIICTSIKGLIPSNCFQRSAACLNTVALCVGETTLTFHCGATKVRRTWDFTIKAATFRQRGPDTMLFVGRIAHYSRGLFLRI